MKGEVEMEVNWKVRIDGEYLCTSLLIPIFVAKIFSLQDFQYGVHTHILTANRYFLNHPIHIIRTRLMCVGKNKLSQSEFLTLLEKNPSHNREITLE